MKTLKIFAALLLCLSTAAAGAQTVERPVLSAYTIEAGSSHLAETYLSPLKYAGWNIALGYERMQAMKFSPERWVMQLQGRLDLQRASNPAGNARMWDLALDLRWGMAHRWHFDGGWTVYAGGSTVWMSAHSTIPATATILWRQKRHGP